MESMHKLNLYYLRQRLSQLLMKTSYIDARRVWTVSQAKTHLSEVLRCAEEEGPQQIGKIWPFIVISEKQWSASNPTRKPMGKWLADNMP